VVNIATMTPEQLAEAGIPMVEALRAKLERAWQSQTQATSDAERIQALGKVYAYADALALAEASTDQ
jgi:hypothetical protein